MTGLEEKAVAVTELLPPGVYPVWSPYDAYEAATALLAALVKEGNSPHPQPLPRRTAEAVGR